jgi:two-component system response regulator HydG
VDTEPKTYRRVARPRVLLVDDDEGILETTAALLEDDYEVVQAVSGEQALSKLALGRFSVVCTDFRMQGMTGIELLAHVREVSRGTAGVLVTGIREQVAKDVIGNEAVFAIVYKPYTTERLLATLNDAARVAAMAFATASFASSSGRLNRERSGGR